MNEDYESDDIDFEQSFYNLHGLFIEVKEGGTGHAPLQQE